MTSADIDTHFRELRVVGAVHDAVDGTVRLLNDFQRFGFRLTSLHLQTRDGIAAEIAMTIAVPAIWESAQVLSRLTRQTAVLSLTIADDVNPMRD